MPVERRDTLLTTSTSVNAALAMAQARQANGMPRSNGRQTDAEPSDSDVPPYNKHSQSTSTTSAKPTSTKPRAPSKTSPIKGKNDHLSVLDTRRSERTKSPAEQLQEAITQPFAHRFSMVGTGRGRGLASGSRSSLSPPHSMHNDTMSSDRLDSVGENTTNDFSRLEREVQAERRDQHQHQPQHQHYQQPHEPLPSIPYNLSHNPTSQTGRSVHSHMTYQTVTQNSTTRSRSKKNIDGKAYVYTEEGMSDDDLSAMGGLGIGIGAHLPVRSTRVSYSQPTHTRPDPMQQNGRRSVNGAGAGAGRTGAGSESDVPSSLSGSSMRDHKDDELEEDVFGGSSQPIRQGRPGGRLFNRRAQQQQQQPPMSQTRRRFSGGSHEHGSTGEDEEVKHTMSGSRRTGGDESDGTYAREKAPFNRSVPRSMRIGIDPANATGKTWKRRIILKKEKGVISKFMSRIGIDGTDGTSLAKLMGILLLLVYAGFALKHAYNQARDTYESFSGSRSVGLPPGGQDAASETAWKHHRQEALGWRDEQASEINEIEGRLRSLTSQVQNAGSVSMDKWERAEQESKEELRRLRAEDKLWVDKEVDGVKGAMKELKEEMKRLKSETGNQYIESLRELRRVEILLRDHERSVKGDMSEVKARLSKVETEMLKMFDEKLWKQTLTRILPTFMPFHRDAQDNMAVDPVFWTEMKKMFAAEKATDGANPQAVQPSWKDFVEENDDKLREWMRQSLGESARHTDSMHSVLFHGVLDEELDKLKVSLLDDMKARAAEGDKKVKIELEKLRAEAHQLAGLRKGDQVPDQVITDSAFTIQQLIDHALLKYSKDTLAKADYALASSGGTVLTHQTSPSLELERPGILGRLWGRKALARDPRVALHGVNDPGYCWAFAGGKGSLGIGLTTRIKVSEITIEHAAKELVPEKALSSAPKHIEIWATPATYEEQAKIERFLEMYPEHQAERTAPTTGAILLTTVEYDPYTERPIQTFQVPHQIQKLGIATDNIVAKFNENWGAEYTCLYRIRVHGQPV